MAAWIQTRRDFWPATVMKFYVQRSYKLEWIIRSSGRDKGMQNLAWRTEVFLRVSIKMPGLFCGRW